MTPYRAHDGAFVMLPGQVPPGALAVVVLVLLAVRAAFQRSCTDAVRCVLVRLGMAATALSLGIGVFQAVTLQRRLLYEGEMAFYGVLGVAQTLCAVVALVGWALGARVLECEGEVSRSKDAPISFLAGELWSMPCMVIVGMAGQVNSPWVPPGLVALTCAVAGGLVAAALALVRRVRLALDPLYLLAGHLSFLAVGLMVGELSLQGLADAHSSLTVCALYAILVLVAVVAAVLSEQRSQGEVSPAENKDVLRKRVVARLDALAVRALSESERAVMVRTALGESTRTIAEELGKAEGTIASFRHRGYEKLDVSSARELRALLASDGVDDSAPDTCEETGESVSYGGAASWEGVAFLVFLVVLALVRPPSQIYLWEETISASYVRGLGKIASLVLASVLPLAAAVAASRALHRRSRRDEAGLRSSEVVDVARLVVAVLFAGCLYATWDGLAGYGLAAFVILTLACIAFGQGAVVLFGRADDARTVLRAGAAWLLSNVPSLALGFSAATMVAHVILLHPTPFFLYDVLPVAVGASVVVSTLALVWGQRTLSERVVEQTAASPAARQRAVFYLRARGMGELQANVLVDLACGLSSREVSSRHSTTSATVASYRRRGYQTLGIHSLTQLCAVLVREAGFPRKGGVP